MAEENPTDETAIKMTSTDISTASDKVINFADIDKLLAGDEDNRMKAYSLLEEYLAKNNEEIEALWRMARACHALSNVAESKGDCSKKKSYILQGIDFSQRALNINSNSAGAHKWFAICVAARGQLSGAKDKIKDGVVFKEHIEEAIKLDPNDPGLYHSLGRFEYEISQLSTMERKVASWLFAEVPGCTIENAIAHLQKFEELNTNSWKENRLLLAKCYIRQKQYDAAIEWLGKALQTPANNYLEAAKLDEEIHKLLKKYESYSKS